MKSTRTGIHEAAEERGLEKGVLDSRRQGEELRFKGLRL